MSDEEIYGTDYSSKGNLTSRGDLGLVSGLENAKQAIKNELLTELGFYPELDSEYGSEIFSVLGEDKTELNLKALAVHINNCLLKQERVSEIENIEPHYTTNGINVFIKILLVNGSEEELEITLEG